MHLQTEHIQRCFNKAAASYDAHNVLSAMVAAQLIARLQYMTIEPTVILDIGSGTGQLMQGLQPLYPQAQTIQLDFSDAMLRQAQQKEAAPCHSYLCANAYALPLQTRSVDLIVSNLCLPWLHDLNNFFAECQRLLRPNGLLIFSSFGPDTLHELRESFASLPAHHAVHAFFDMHDVGDSLVHAGLIDPVMDVEHCVLQYQSLDTLFADLKGQGATNVLAERQRGLLTPRQLQTVRLAYDQFRSDEAYPATFEVIYGHAWAGETLKNKKVGNDVHVPFDNLRRR